MVKRTPKKRSTSSRRSIIPTLCIVLGLILLVNFMLWKVHQTYIAYITTPPSTYDIKHNLNAPAPERILIPKAKISVPITEAVIKDGIWGVSNTNVSHLMTSANPGENGNIILYGHDKKDILQSLNKVKVGDLITIVDVKNAYHVYKVASIATTSPTDTSILNTYNKEKLVVYTCTGFFDSKRIIVSANPV